MKIIVLLGLPLSGKTTHAKRIQDILGFEIPLVETGSFVYKKVEEEGYETTPENIKNVVTRLKHEYGEAIFTKIALDFIKSNYLNKILVFISGVKAYSEIDLLKTEMGAENVYSVTFHASFKSRYSRLLNKDRKLIVNKNKQTEDQAMANDISLLQLRDAKELAYGLGRLIALSDYIVNTEDKLWPYKNFEQTLQDFKTLITDIIK